MRTTVRLGATAGLSLEWKDRLDAVIGAPASIFALARNGPLLMIDGSSSLWIAVQDLALSSGTQATLLDGSYEAGRESAVGARLRTGIIALLFPQERHSSVMQVASLRWTCLLPSSVLGYDTTLCQGAVLLPLSSVECVVSCADGYRVVGRPHAECPPPPQLAVFRLQGCAARECNAPSGIPNALGTACTEGRTILSGALCHPRCAPGYQASHKALECRAGDLIPNGFHCIATCCLQHFAKVPSRRVHAQVVAEGGFLGPLFTAVNALRDDGQVWLTPQRHGSWFVLDLARPHYIQALRMRNVGSVFGNRSTDAFSVMGKVGGYSDAQWHAVSVNALESSPTLREVVPLQEAKALKFRLLNYTVLTFRGEGGGLSFLEVLGKPSDDVDNDAIALPQCVALPSLHRSCPAPRAVEHAKNPSCAQGKYIASQSTCTPACQAGHSSTVHVLSCVDGDLEPTNFACIPVASGDSDDQRTQIPYLVTALLCLKFMLPEDLDPDPGGLTAGIRARDAGILGFLKAALEVSLLVSPGQLVVEVNASKPGDIASAGRRVQESRQIASEVLGFPSAVNVSVRVLVDNRTESYMLVSRLTLIFARGDEALAFKSKLTLGWTRWLAGQAGDGWLDVSGRANVSVQKLTPELLATLPAELQRYALATYDSMVVVPEGVAAKETSGGREGSSDLTSGMLGPLHEIAVESFGDKGVLILIVGLVLVLGALLWCPALCYFECCVRGRLKLRQGSQLESQFRAIYVIPESHRHQWRLGRLQHCCRCKQRHIHPRRWFCLRFCCPRRCCESGVHLDCPAPAPQLQALCLLCCCPCFRVPETWHVSGVLSFRLGVLLCYGCPVCLPCIGGYFRTRLRKVFAMPPQPCCDFLAWLCCCCVSALQEALHVDGAADAVVAQMTAQTTGQISAQSEPSQLRDLGHASAPEQTEIEDRDEPEVVLVPGMGVYGESSGNQGGDKEEADEDAVVGQMTAQTTGQISAQSEPSQLRDLGHASAPEQKEIEDRDELEVVLLPGMGVYGESSGDQGVDKEEDQFDEDDESEEAVSISVNSSVANPSSLQQIVPTTSLAPTASGPSVNASSSSSSSSGSSSSSSSSSHSSSSS